VRYADPNTTQWVIATNQPGPTGPAGQTWTVGTGLTLSANTLSLTTPALPLTGGTVAGNVQVNGTTTANGQFWGVTGNFNTSLSAPTKATGSVTGDVATTQFVDRDFLAKSGGTLTGKLTVNSSNLLLGAGATGYITRPAGTDSLLLSNEAGTNLNQIGLIAATSYANADFTVFGNQLNYGSIVVGSPTGGAKGAGTVNAVSVYANNVVLTSDADLKHDIGPLPCCLDLIREIEPKSFRWNPLPLSERGIEMPKEFTERHNWGFLAQDVEKATGAHRSEGVDLGGLVATLWQAVRELSAKVEALEAAR